MKNKDLKQRILDISYTEKLSHLGSALTSVDIIAEIFSIKKRKDAFILSAGHAGLALYVVLEKYGFGDALKMFHKSGVHPDREALKTSNGIDELVSPIDCSTGSLGHGLGIGVGMALADRSRMVYVLISDGECAEGSIYEALRVKKEYNVDNLIVYLNYNGYSAYKEVNINDFKAILPEETRIVYTDLDDFYFLDGLDAHYHVMTEDEYKVASEVLNESK